MIQCSPHWHAENVVLFPREIAEELSQQEEILAKLHEDMKKGTPDEVRMWCKLENPCSQLWTFID